MCEGQGSLEDAERAGSAASPDTSPGSEIILLLTAGSAVDTGRTQ